MEGEKDKLYTPFVLRTGFMHSIRRTLLLLLSLIVLEVILWTLGGFWTRFDELGLLRWGLIIILALIVPIGVWTIRDIVGDYQGLFNVFDERTESRMKLYRSMRQTTSEPQEELYDLFKDEMAYTTFKDEIREIIGDRITEITTLSISIVVTMVVLYSTIYEKLDLRGAVSRFPLSILEIAIDAFSSFFIILALSLIFLFGVGYLRTIAKLGASKGRLGIWNYIDYLHGASVEDGSFTSFWRFHRLVSIIGQHFSTIAFRIVLLAVLGGLVQVLYNTSTPTIVTWILALFPLVIGVLVLVLPLNSLHRFIEDAKSSVLRELEEEYDHLSMKFIAHLSEQRQAGTTGQEKDNHRDIALKVTSLRGIIEDTRQKHPWPVNSPMILRILATSLIPIIYIFIEELMRIMGIL